MIGVLFTGCSMSREPGIVAHQMPKTIESVIEENGEEESVLFEDPFEAWDAVAVEPYYMQWGSGEDYYNDRTLKVYFDEEVKDPSLIWVNRTLESSERLSPVSKEVQGDIWCWQFEVPVIDTHDYVAYGWQVGEMRTPVYEMNGLNGVGEEFQSEAFVVLGDLQGYLAIQYDHYAANLESMMWDESFDGVLLLGDVVDQGDSLEQWQYYMTATKTVSLDVPILSAIGNHDVKGSRDFYEVLFDYPMNGCEGLPNSTGYVDTDYARIAMIDTESPSYFPEQMAWLEEIMSETDKPYKIVMMHRSVNPVFYQEPHMKVWAEVIETLDIDLVLSGHDHIYSRTMAQDTAYVVTGSGSGSKFYDQILSSGPWEVVYDEDVAVVSTLSMSEESIEFTAYAMFEEGPKVVDFFTIK